MKKTLYFEAPTEEEEKERLKKSLQKSLDYSKKENWAGQINDILDLAKRKGIELDY